MKFKKALLLDSRKHDALWCLGNAYTSQARPRSRTLQRLAVPCLLVVVAYQRTDRALTGARLLRQGFLTTDTGRAHEFFDLANDCFKKAIAEVRRLACQHALTWLS